jgi:hypothetical protein
MGSTAEEMTGVATQRVNEAPKEVKFEIPPKSLIGSDEDTLRSCLSLHPKPAPKDQVKMLKHLHDILRFRCHMITRNSIDATRSFILTYFMSDDTIQVFEPPQRNSGVVAGKWLQRTKLINPDTGRSFQASDFEVGKVVTINCSKFQLDEATEFAMSYMESDPDTFQQSDLFHIVNELQTAIKSKNLDRRKLFEQYSRNGKLNLDGLLQIYQECGLNISKHEAITVMRRYQLENEPNTLTIKEFLQFA